MPSRIGSRQASWDSQSEEEEGAAEGPSDPAAAELSSEGGSLGKGRGRGGGHSTGFVGPCQRQSRGQRKRGKEQARKPDDRQHQDKAVSV